MESAVLRLSDRLVAVLPNAVGRWLERPLAGLELTSSGLSGPAAWFARCAWRFVGVWGVLLIVVHVGVKILLDPENRFFDADYDYSVWSWASISAEAGAAFGLVLLAAFARTRWPVVVLATVALYFSSDDFLRIHENLGSLMVPFPEAVRVLWPLFYLPLLAGFMLFTWRLAQGLVPAARAMVRLGLLGLVVAVGLEVASPAAIKFGGYDSLLYALEVAFEEALELCCWMLVAAGAATAVLNLQADPQRR